MTKYKANNRKRTKGRAVRLQTIEWTPKNPDGTDVMVEVPAAYFKNMEDPTQLGKLMRPAYKKPLIKRVTRAHINT